MNFKEIFPEKKLKKENDFLEEKELTRGEIIKKLIELGNRTGNRLVFKDFGSKFELDAVHANSQARERLEKGQIWQLEDYLKRIKSYLSGPTFTDDFHENHGVYGYGKHLSKQEIEKSYSRRDWEKDNISPGKIGPEIYKYYNANKLGGNKMANVIGFLNEISMDIIKNQEVKEKLGMFLLEIPQELKENEEGYRPYDLLSDEKKLEIVEKFSKFVEKVLYLLEEPQKDGTAL